MQIFVTSTITTLEVKSNMIDNVKAKIQDNEGLTRVSVRQLFLLLTLTNVSSSLASSLKMAIPLDHLQQRSSVLLSSHSWHIHLPLISNTWSSWANSLRTDVPCPTLARPLPLRLSCPTRLTMSKRRFKTMKGKWSECVLPIIKLILLWCIGSHRTSSISSLQGSSLKMDVHFQITIFRKNRPSILVWHSLCLSLTYLC